MVIASLILMNFLMLIGAYAAITWLSGDDVLRPIRVEVEPDRKRPH